MLDEILGTLDDLDKKEFKEISQDEIDRLGEIDPPEYIVKQREASARNGL